MVESEQKVSSVLDDHIDDRVDEDIKKCLVSNPPKSFFVFAGAGSGKTRSLINTLEFLAKDKGEDLAERGKQIAVITYTNAACDEINRRIQYNPIFHVSTIHSFLWDLIKSFQSDIKNWVEKSIEKELTELLKSNQKRATPKRTAQIEKKQQRLQNVRHLRRFSYNPNGDNIGVDSLSHDEVIKMGTEFIFSEQTMQQILVSKFPIFLIDESQDTNKELVDALLKVYENHKNQWVIGMFGDTMQRVYFDGNPDLEKVIPADWICPVKVMNHRSSKRIVDLANSIRKIIDNKAQWARSDAQEGAVRLFIVNVTGQNDTVEKFVAQRMAKITFDLKWTNEEEHECLILEHHMVARRLGFMNLYNPLNRSGVFATALRKGEIPEISFLANMILPLINAYKRNDSFEVARLVRQYSPLLDKKNFGMNPAKQKEMLERADSATVSLVSLWDNEKIPSCIEVLQNIKTTGLFEVSERMKNILDPVYLGDDRKVNPLKEALNVPFDEMERYFAYVSDRTRFATQQGVKGLEFSRVMVVIDDQDMKGFSFSYDKLFGTKNLTDTDLRNEREGKDTSVTRTARLFYVACTRAKESLAVVVYTRNPYFVKNTALNYGWFSENEIEMVQEQDIH